MKDFKAYLDLVKEYWNNKFTVYLIVPLSFIGSLIIFNQAFGDFAFKYRICMSGLFSIIMLFVWLISNRIPKSSKGKVGFIISINIENTTDFIKFKNDFIDVLKNLLYNEHVITPFEILLYNNYQSSLVNINNFIQYLDKSYANFILFGSLKVRNGKNNKNKYVLKLIPGVKHAVIPLELSKLLAKDFSRLMNYNIEIPFENEDQHFEMQADLVLKVAKYMVGIASYISSDFDYAISLFEDLKQSNNLKTKYYNNNKYKKVINNINKTLSTNLFNMYKSKVDHMYGEWIISRSTDSMTKISIITDKALLIKPNDYFFINMKAICIFLLEGDVDKSLITINRNRREKDAVWLISRAFLYSYKGELLNAYRDYITATKYNMFDQTVPIQTETFINEILEKNPQLYFLRFSLGIINYYFKDDYNISKTEFNKFLQDCPINLYEDIRQIINTLLIEIEKKVIGNQI